MHTLTNPTCSIKWPALPDKYLEAKTFFLSCSLRTLRFCNTLVTTTKKTPKNCVFKHKFKYHYAYCACFKMELLDVVIFPFYFPSFLSHEVFVTADWKKMSCIPSLGPSLFLPFLRRVCNSKSEIPC
jgi:hypothetical protein